MATSLKLKYLSLLSIIPFLYLLLIQNPIELSAQRDVTPDAWRMYGHDERHTNRSSANGPNTASLKWTYDTGEVIRGSGD